MGSDRVERPTRPACLYQQSPSHTLNRPNTMSNHSELPDMDDMSMEMAVGKFVQQSGKMRPVKSLGHGSQGEVFLYVVKGFGNVAVKMLNTNGDKLKYTKREIIASLRLSFHPNILGFYGLFYVEEPKDQMTMQNGYVMEYMKGGSLMDVIFGQMVNYGLRDVLNWTRQAAMGLMFMHDNNILHRDVNPNNMLLSRDMSKLKISDLGYATEMGKYRHTQNVGTQGYRAPEVISGGDYGKPCDVYSLGITIWVMLNRGVPWNGNNAFRLHHAVVNEGWRPDTEQLGQIQLELPFRHGIVKLLKRCWDADPAQRPTMSGLLDYIEEFCIADSVGLERLI